ncbi:N-6 DNA methylase [Sandaracinus amylolyticus]|uniref:class I SAM-dependent DNA methyltransferase n=1 Tax=Sandaracinus amylolyticus TaxID=927083 RepID=UPI001F15930B|nr:N-6 DNA methylase [Sandaracinus amylolyticus]UJR78527.1 Type I restriction-modification system methyltransferase subunit [Sandaracinus amylolyticus]
MNTTDIVQKLWNLCHVLRDDGITYHQYVTELTWLLFLKMAQETQRESQLPKGYRWADLEQKDGLPLLTFYRQLLLHLGTQGSPRVQAIFANASTSLKEPRNLKKLVDSIDDLDWYSAKTEGLGEMYEGLLEKNASEKKSGAGQYFTPRPLIDSMIAVIQPQAGELVQDPAAGTAGFLIAADRYIKERTDNLFELKEKQQVFQRTKAFYGVELVPDTHRLALMNLMLHDLEGDLLLGDALSPTGSNLPKADIILTNPPFGTKKGGGLPTRDDFTFPTSNKQLAFLQHIYRGLKPGGRAAVVLPDNVLFEENVGTRIREDLMEKCDLHTILRLPTGIFYAQGVKTNVLFFTKGEKDVAQTKNVWVYDLRANMPSFGKRTPLTREHFAEFEKAFGADPLGKSKRKDQGEEGRFQKFTRDDIKRRGDNLDIAWLKDESASANGELGDPEEIAAEIMSKLQIAMDEIESLQRVLRGEERA